MQIYIYARMLECMYAGIYVCKHSYRRQKTGSKLVQNPSKAVDSVETASPLVYDLSEHVGTSDER